MNLGIRGLLALGLFFLLAVAGAVATMLVGHFLEAETTNQVERQQLLRAVEIAARLELVCAPGDRAACDAEVRAAAAPLADDLEELTVLDTQLGIHAGAPLPCAQRDALVAAAFQGRAVQAEVRAPGPESCAEGESAERFVVAVPIARPERLVCRFGFDRAPLQSALASRRRTVLFALLADFIAVLLFGIYLVGRSVVAPVIRLTELTGRIAELGLALAPDPRAALAAGPTPPRELLTLGRAYGEMLDRLREQDALLRERLTELTSARDDLVRSEKLATVGRLAAGIAHEVGNPLAAVLGFVEYLRDERGVTPELQRDLLLRMDQELNRIQGTIRQLLDFSRAESPKPRTVRVAEVVEGAIALVRYQPKIKALELVVDVDPTLVVDVDPERLRHVLLNLVLNAADAVSGRGRVEVTATLESGEVVLRVADDGPGVDAAVADRIFEPFVSTKPAGEGTGLGLAICQRLVEEAGGRIALGINANGRGACFEVRLPAAV